MSSNEDVSKEYLLGPGDRVRLQKWWCKNSDPVRAKYTAALRGTIVDVDESGRECASYEVEWDGVTDFDELFHMAEIEVGCCDVQGDSLEPAGATPEKAKEELMKSLGCDESALTAAFLTEMVEDYKQSEAIDINDEGEEAQIEYILKARKKCGDGEFVTLVFRQ